MSEKQDRTYARTAQDIERKYSFGKSFAEMLGLINDSRDKVDSVESSLRDVTEQTTTLRRDTEEIVMRATESIADLSNKVELKLDASDVSIEIEKQIAEGVDRVVTKTGYVFDDDGLNITKTGEALSNKIDNTGVYVTRTYDNKEMLTANDDGVVATDLHAKGYLIVGDNNGRSRFESYLTNRVGCFWGGDN